MAQTDYINLLPDIKRERMRRQRIEQYTRLGAYAVIGGSVLALLVVGGAAFYQRHQLLTAQEGIEQERAAIAEIEDRNELRGMQIALERLPELAEQKIFMAQLPKVLEQVVPDRVSLESFEYISGGEVEFVAKSGSYRDIYTFVDALEKVQGRVVVNNQESDRQRFFRDVQLDENSGSGEEITFSIQASFNEQMISAASLQEVAEQESTEAENSQGGS
jgi:hypothetical protein